jgi:hypothetical protein
MIALYQPFTFSLNSYPPIVPSCCQVSRGRLAYSVQVIWKLPGMEVEAEVEVVVAGVGGTIMVHRIAAGVTHFIHAPQIMNKIPRVLTETTEVGAITDTAGVEATLINNQHIRRDPLTHRLSNNSMGVMVDTVVEDLLQDGRRKIMVVMDLVVVLLRLEAVLPIMALRMDKVGMAGMERLIMDIVAVIVTMADMVLIMDTGIKAEDEEARHIPRLVEEAGLGSYIYTMLDFM